MKKLLSIMAFALISMGANAQVFCDAEGNELTNDTTLVMPFVEDDEQCPLVNFGVKNNTGAKMDITVNVKNISMPFGDFMCCVGTSCTIIPAEGNQDYTFSAVEAGKSVKWTNTEWSPTNAEGELQPGECVIEFTIGDQKVTVKFVYDDTAVKGIQTVEAKSQKAYNAAGQLVGKDAKGLIISNGVKVIK